MGKKSRRKRAKPRSGRPGKEVVPDIDASLFRTGPLTSAVPMVRYAFPGSSALSGTSTVKLYRRASQGIPVHWRDPTLEQFDEFQHPNSARVCRDQLVWLAWGAATCWAVRAERSVNGVVVDVDGDDGCREESKLLLACPQSLRRRRPRSRRGWPTYDDAPRNPKRG